MISLVVPIEDCINKTIYFKGFVKDQKASGNSPLQLSVKDNKRVVVLSSTDTTGNVWNAKNLITVDADKGIYGIAINSTNFPSLTVSNCDGIAINMAYSTSTISGTTVPSDAIMTIGNSNI